MDSRAIITGGWWPETSSELNFRIGSYGFLQSYSVGITSYGVTDSLNSSWLDSTGDIIYDSLGAGDLPALASVLANGYWNANLAETYSRIASWGYVGVLTGLPGVGGVMERVTSWLGLQLRMRR